MKPRSRRLLRRQAVLSLVGLAVAACSAPRPTEPSGPAADLPEFESRLERIRAELKIPGISAAIVQDGKPLWSRGVGYADVEGRVPATPGTSFHLASLTKTFASVVILQLVEAGKLDLDAPVSEFGIELPGPGVVRVRHLLTHTSEGTPGTTFRYNGSRFGLLDRVIERAAGRSFADLVVDRVIRPTGLAATAPNPQDAPSFAFSGLDRAGFERNLAQGYTPDGSRREAYPGTFGTAAGLVSSAADMAAYSIALDSDRLLSATMRERAWTPAISLSGDTLPYGLGWFVTRYHGVRVVWHYGYWTANSSLIIKVPDRGLTFVVLANTDGLSRPFNLGAGDLLSSPVAREFLGAFVRD